MALQENLMTFSYVSVAAVDQYRMVAADTTATHAAKVAPAATAPIGVVLNKATAAGQALTVANNGIIKVIADAAIATGGLAVAVGASGGAAPAVATNVAFGYSVAPAAAGEVCEIHWLGPWVVA